MDRTDAERVFELVRELNGNLAGRIVSERWWLVWIVLGLQMLASCAATQWLVWRGEARLQLYAAVWAVHVLFIPIIIRAIQLRGGGQRTATEGYIWWIWSAYLLCGTILALHNSLVGLPLSSAPPTLALLAAFSFGMLAMVTHRGFLLCALYFAAVMAAESCIRNAEFLLFGGAWCALLVALGLCFRFRLPDAAGRQL